MKIGLFPLDERPVNTRYPRLIGEIAGVEVVIPATLSQFRTPANHDAIQEWLITQSQHLDGLIVSIEMLAYGGLIPSRISHDELSTVIERITILRRLRAEVPDLPIYGFNLITRVSRHDDATEEPLYWAEYGSTLFALSSLLHRRELGHSVDIEALNAQIPPIHRDDFLKRRARNHQVNRAALDLLKSGVLDLLILSSDDTSQFGLGSSEKAKLTAYATELGLSDGQLLMYPGADEVGCVLLMRMINAAHQQTPTFYPVYMLPDGKDVVAPFEDVPIHVTVERQIAALGGCIQNEDYDFKLLVNPPVAPDAEWVREYTAAERQQRLPALRTALADSTPEKTLIADVAFANGADHELMQLLQQPTFRPLSFAAWNTAGNTIGTVLATGNATLYNTPAAGQYFLAHRFIEDWLYQSLLRNQAGQITTWLEDQLNQAIMEQLPWLPYRIVSGSLRLPWQRLFEIDFELERL